MKDIDRYQKLKLIDGLKAAKYQAGDFIINEGEKGDDFYIIEKGEVECGKVS